MRSYWCWNRWHLHSSLAATRQHQSAATTLLRLQASLWFCHSDLCCAQYQTRLLATRCCFADLEKRINIIVINNLHFNQVSRQRFISYLCCGLFHKISFSGHDGISESSCRPRAQAAPCVGVSSHACCSPFNRHDTITSTGVF